MKNISKETLEIIESRSTTDYQSQEFTRKRDNLLTKSWKDFEIKDLKPNLIPNGWDSFEPYGSGKNYVENWDFSTEENWLSFMTKFEYVDNRVVIDFDNNHGGIQQNVNGLSGGTYVLRARVRVSGKDPATMRFQWGGEYCGMIEVENNNEWFTMETEMKGSGDATFFVYKARPSTNRVEIDWVQITPKDNQHLVVEKTPLGNGLTRIQTWGGKHPNKLVLSGVYTEKENRYTFSSFMSNLSETLRVNMSNYGTIIVGKDEHITMTSRGLGNAGIYIRVRARESDYNLDFIASDPQIVEGDVANPVLIVTDLDNGREHVQVYGATTDTKLVLKDGKGFVGENYRLTSTIQNKGIELTANTSIGDADIPKGDSKLDIQGDLKEQEFTIELGARNA